MSRCPPGVICFENFTFTFVIIALFVIIYFVYNRQFGSNGMKQQHNMNISNAESNSGLSNTANIGIDVSSLFGLFPRPSYSF